MTNEIVPIEIPPMYKPSSFEQLLQKTLDKVSRWEDPIQAGLSDLDKRLIGTRDLVGIALSTVAHLPCGDRLQSEIETSQASLCQIPATALEELDRLLSEHHSGQRSAHLRLLRQYHLLHAERRHIKAAERLLVENLFVQPRACADIVARLRDLYSSTYVQLKTQYDIDGHLVHFGLNRPIVMPSAACLGRST